MKVFCKSLSNGRRNWLHVDLFKKGHFKAAIMYWEGVYPVCPIRFN